MVQICVSYSSEAEIMAEWMGLSEHLDRSVILTDFPVERLKVGMLQLMAQKPELLLLDEPESGVDVENIALVAVRQNIFCQVNPASVKEAAARILRRQSGLARQPAGKKAKTPV